MADIKRKGYGQVEPNHLSAQRTGQIYAQLPLDEDIKVLENGQFMKYDYENNEVNLTGDGEWYLVYNEEKLYDERHQGRKDFALRATDFVDKVVTPRLFKTNIGDIYTTNCIGMANTDAEATVNGLTVNVGDTLKVNKKTGYLVAASNADADASMEWKVVKIYTMPDAQPAVKIMRMK